MKVDPEQKREFVEIWKSIGLNVMLALGALAIFAAVGSVFVGLAEVVGLRAVLYILFGGFILWLSWEYAGFTARAKRADRRMK